MKKILIVLIVIVAVVVGIAIVRKTNRNSQTEKRAAESESLAKAPNFSLQDYNGKTVSLADFPGKPLVINSWASWCPFCRQELPDFVTVQKELGDKIIFIAIDRAEPLSVAKQYSDQLGVSTDLVFLLDPGDSFYRDIGGFAMPETIFVDRQGRIRDHKRGPMSAAEIRERIKNVME